MNVFVNVWKHPRTTVTGLLIGVTTVTGVLSQQGLTLGHAGSGTVVTLVGAVASALLGLMARDPVSNAGSGTDSGSDAGAVSGGSKTGVPAAAKVGVVALIALLLPAPFVSGCSGNTVAQDIVNWTPALETAVATVDSTAALMVPADAAVFTTATANFDALARTLAVQAKAYLANPSASTLAQLQVQVVAFEQQANAALLEAAHITNATSQQHALTVIRAVATIAATMLALAESVSSKTAVAQMAGQSTVKLAAVERYMDREAAAGMVARHYGEPVEMARVQVEEAQAGLVEAGF
ncbi:MAG: hypothetical protein P4L40_01240 [Terracidiphilus sp.]|nr:hypothetical protein [Terracidiphilus sp.]